MSFVSCILILLFLNDNLYQCRANPLENKLDHGREEEIHDSDAGNDKGNLASPSLQKPDQPEHENGLKNMQSHSTTAELVKDCLNLYYAASHIQFAMTNKFKEIQNNVQKEKAENINHKYSPPAEFQSGEKLLADILKAQQEFFKILGQLQISNGGSKPENPIIEGGNDMSTLTNDTSTKDHTMGNTNHMRSLDIGGGKNGNVEGSGDGHGDSAEINALAAKPNTGSGDDGTHRYKSLPTNNNNENEMNNGDNAGIQHGNSEGHDGSSGHSNDSPSVNNGDNYPTQNGNSEGHDGQTGSGHGETTVNTSNNNKEDEMNNGNNAEIQHGNSEGHNGKSGGHGNESSVHNGDNAGIQHGNTEGHEGHTGSGHGESINTSNDNKESPSVNKYPTQHGNSEGHEGKSGSGHGESISTNDLKSTVTANSNAESNGNGVVTQSVFASNKQGGNGATSNKLNRMGSSNGNKDTRGLKDGAVQSESDKQDDNKSGSQYTRHLNDDEDSKSDKSDSVGHADRVEGKENKQGSIEERGEKGKGHRVLH